MQDRSCLLPNAAVRRAPSNSAPLPPPSCGCACSLPPVRSTGAPVAPGASVPPATLPCAPAPSSPVRCSRTPVPPAVQSPVCRCLPYTSLSVAYCAPSPRSSALPLRSLRLCVEPTPSLSMTFSCFEAHLSPRVDLVRHPVLDLLPRVAQVLERQLLEHLLLQRLRCDSQIQQLLGVVQFIAEIADVEFVHSRYIDRHLVLPRLRDRPQHLLHRVLHHVPVPAQHLLRHAEVSLLAEPAHPQIPPAGVFGLVHQIANTVDFVL